MKLLKLKTVFSLLDIVVYLVELSLNYSFRNLSFIQKYISFIAKQNEIDEQLFFADES